MSNKAFAQYVTSAAFRLELSSGMIKAMLAIDADDSDHGAFIDYMGSRCVSCATPLERRGLVKHVMNKGYFLTDAGKQVVGLLKLAGYSIEKFRKAA
jgi:hypothetical protein